MKKIIALLLALVMVLSLAACAAKDNTADDKAEESKPAADETAKEEEAKEETPAEDTKTEEPAETTDDAAMSVAFITDVGNIDDHSFNQYSYEGVTEVL